MAPRTPAGSSDVSAGCSSPARHAASATWSQRHRTWTAGSWLEAWLEHHAPGGDDEKEQDHSHPPRQPAKMSDRLAIISLVRGPAGVACSPADNRPAEKNGRTEEGDPAENPRLAKVPGV